MNRYSSAVIDELLELYRTMCRIRAFEEAASQALKDGRVTGAVHLSIGQEAIAAGVCHHLTSDDVITTTHRGHGHTIAKGASPSGMMSELFGRVEGVCGGMGGSMHIADFSVGMLGANGVVAAGLPIAVGAAHGFVLRSETGRISVAFFGDGAINRGPFLESLNWAQVFELPVLFVCEDNGYSATTSTRLMTGGEGASARAKSLGVPATQVDGNDVLAVSAATARLVSDIRSGSGPKFLHAHTYRLLGHTAVDTASYRPTGEAEQRWENDPIKRCAEHLISLEVEIDEIQSIEAETKAEVARAEVDANSSAWPGPDRLWRDVQDLGMPCG